MENISLTIVLSTEHYSRDMTTLRISGAFAVLLLLATITVNVEGQRMPIRMLIERIQERRKFGPETDARQFNQFGSQSQAQSNALTNAINVAGIPITNTVSGAQTSSTSGSNSGSINEQFNLGGLGLNAGIDSDKVGTGFEINRMPGQIGLHLGGLNVGLINNGGLLGDLQNTQTQTSATSTATGQGATSSSSSNTQSGGFHLGNLFDIQNTLSSSQAQSTSATGGTSATASANAASQNTNAFQPNQGYQQPTGQPLNQPQIFSNPYNQYYSNPFNNYYNPYQQFPQSYYPQNTYPNQMYGQQYPYPHQHHHHQHPHQSYPYQQYPISQVEQQPTPGPQNPNQHHPVAMGEISGAQPPLSLPGLSTEEPNNQNIIIQGQTIPNGLSPEFQNVLNNYNQPQTVLSQQIPMPTIHQGGAIFVQGNGNDVQPSVDLDAPGAEFGLDVRVDDASTKSLTTETQKESNSTKKIKSSVDATEGNQNSGRSRRSADDSVSFPKDDETEQVSVMPQPDVSNQNSTQPEDLESRFGLFGGGRGPIRDLVHGLVNNIINGNENRHNVGPYQAPIGAYSNGYERPPYERPPYEPPHAHQHNHHHGRPEFHPQAPHNHQHNNQQPYHPSHGSSEHVYYPDQHHQNVPQNQVPNRPIPQNQHYQPPNQYQQPQQQQQLANANGVAQNQNSQSNQNAASNTHSSNVQNQFGNFQNNGGSSISSNLGNDGSGQLSAANTDQQSYQTAQGSGEKNNAQSQSANFDKNGNLGTSSSNAGTQHISGPDGDRNQANSASNAHQQTQHGISNSNSQTLAETLNQNGVSGNKASGQTTSSFQGNDGSTSLSTSGSETQSWGGPNSQGTSASSQSSSQNFGGAGGNLGTSSSTGSGTSPFGNQAFSNSNAFNQNQFGGGGGGAQTNSFSGANNGGANAGANANAYNQQYVSKPFIFSK